MYSTISNVVSRGFGKFAEHEFSPTLQKFINRSYVKILGLNMNQFSQPESYATLNKLFTRELEVERTFSKEQSDVISPVDSFVTQAGVIEDGRALQIKKMSYLIKNLLTHYTSSGNIERLTGGSFVNFYLSPKDYHRFHIPMDCTLERLIHVPGKLYPVNVPTLRRKLNLFVENERVIAEFLSREGELFYMVLVGALNVGKMVVNSEPKIETNVDEYKITVYEYNEVRLQKGDEFGYFKMGSTVVLLSEKGLLNLNIENETKVGFGQTIATK